MLENSTIETLLLHPQKKSLEPAPETDCGLIIINYTWSPPETASAVTAARIIIIIWLKKRDMDGYEYSRSVAETRSRSRLIRLLQRLYE